MVGTLVDLSYCLSRRCLGCVDCLRVTAPASFPWAGV